MTAPRIAALWRGTDGWLRTIDIHRARAFYPPADTNGVEKRLAESRQGVNWDKYELSLSAVRIYELHDVTVDVDGVLGQLCARLDEITEALQGPVIDADRAAYDVQAVATALDELRKAVAA